MSGHFGPCQGPLPFTSNDMLPWTGLKPELTDAAMTPHPTLMSCVKPCIDLRNSILLSPKTQTNKKGEKNTSAPCEMVQSLDPDSPASEVKKLTAQMKQLVMDMTGLKKASC